jgi:hypothetical protein
MIPSPPQITTWKDWAEILLGWAIASFLIGFFSAATRDALNHWRQSRRIRSRHALIDRARHAWIDPVREEIADEIEKRMGIVSNEFVAARAAASKLNFFNVPRLGLFRRLRESIAEWLTHVATRIAPPVTPPAKPAAEGRMVAREDGVIEHRDALDEIYAIYCKWAGDVLITNATGREILIRKVAAGSLLPVKSSKPPVFTPAVPPGPTVWPQCMGLGIGAAMAHRRQSELLGLSAAPKFVRMVGTVTPDAGIVATRLEGRNDAAQPWSPITVERRDTSGGVRWVHNPPRPPFPEPHG